MTPDQLNYVYKHVRKHMRTQGMKPLKRGEFVGMLGMMGIDADMDIVAHDFATQLTGQIDDFMTTVNAPTNDLTELEKLINMELPDE